MARAGGDPENVHGEDITPAATAGDEGALSVLEELGWWVALGLANLVAVSDPERCVIGGGLAEAGELLLGPTRRAFAELVEGASARPDIEIVPAALGERAGAVGAALVAGSAGASSVAPRLGVMLPIFRDDPARRSHWPPRPTGSGSTACSSTTTCGRWGARRPALAPFPLLGALAAAPRGSGSARSWPGSVWSRRPPGGAVRGVRASWPRGGSWRGWAPATT